MKVVQQAGIWQLRFPVTFRDHLHRQVVLGEKTEQGLIQALFFQNIEFRMHLKIMGFSLLQNRTTLPLCRY